MEHESLSQMYPWNDLLRQEYSSSIKRDFPSIPGAKVPDEQLVERILLRVLIETLNGNKPLRENLYEAHLDLCNMFESLGYPGNSRNLPEL